MDMTRKTDLSWKTDDSLKVSVRGMQFTIRKDFLESHPESQISKLLLGAAKNSENGGCRELYLNRDPFVFSQILDYLVHGEIHVTQGTCSEIVRRELQFWGVDESAVATCCRMQLLEQSEMLNDFRLFIDKRKPTKVMTQSTEVDGAEAVPADILSDSTMRQRIWAGMENPQCNLAKVYHLFVLSFNILSVLVMVLASVPECRQQIDQLANQAFDQHSQRGPTTVRVTDNDVPTTSGALVRFLNSTQPVPALGILEVVCACVLLVDILIYFICSPGKWRFFICPMNIIGMVSILIMWLSIALHQTVATGAANGADAYHAMHVVESFRFLRIFYICHSMRSYKPLTVIQLSMRQSSNELALLFMLLGVGTLVFGSLIFMTEMHYDTVWGIPNGIWWAVVTMTTVGYGDIYPISAPGKIVGIFCAITGILVIALPIPIIGSNFGKYYKIYRMSERLATSQRSEHAECHRAVDKKTKTLEC